MGKNAGRFVLYLVAVTILCTIFYYHISSSVSHAYMSISHDMMTEILEDFKGQVRLMRDGEHSQGIVLESVRQFKARSTHIDNLRDAFIFNFILSDYAIRYNKACVSFKDWLCDRVDEAVSRKIMTDGRIL